MAQNPQQNYVLSSLSQSDYGLLEEYLEPVDLPVRKVLERRGRKISAIYFPESGFASVVANGITPIEVGIIGREGMTGLAVILGDDSNANDVFMQVAGQGHCMRGAGLPSGTRRQRVAPSLTASLRALVS